MNYSLRGLAYFCLVEALNENSSFSEKIIEDIKKKYGKNSIMEAGALHADFMWQSEEEEGNKIK